MKKMSQGMMAVAVAAALSLTATARAQDSMQLTVPTARYSLGRFTYEAPKADGWRQLANVTNSLTLIYAEQKTPDAIETLFGATLEAHDIPEGTQVESAAALADLSRRQIADTRKEDLVAMSAIEAVPSVDNLYTYRLLVHAPTPNVPDAYEVYYVALSPDKTQYVVVQCITKTVEYANELYFTQFYGSLASLKYAGAAVAGNAAGNTAGNAAGNAAGGAPKSSAAAQKTEAAAKKTEAAAKKTEAAAKESGAAAKKPAAAAAKTDTAGKNPPTAAAAEPAGH